MTLRYGSLFSGYGGLDLGLQSVLGGSTAWHVEFDKHPSAILAHHWPDVPNYGDITKVDFTKVEPVDVLTGGFPCQDVSHAGRRAGLIRDGEGRTRSGLWGEMLRAITELRPRLVVAENVRGLLSAAADSDVEPCPWCLGDANGEPDMRALGAVLADLADVGYDAWWVGLRAADVGGAHGRFRVFIFAVPADPEGDPWRLGDGDSCTSADTADNGSQVQLITRSAETEHGCPGVDRGSTGRQGIPSGLTLLPTPDAYSSDRGGSQHPDKRRAGGHQPTIADVAEHLLPTPRATDGTKGGPNQRGSSGDLMLPSAVQLLPTPRAQEPGATNEGYGLSLNEAVGASENGRNQTWGDYAPAIARWERVICRPAPEPTEPGPKGSPRLSARFVEWLMGLPAGHVTDVDIPRNAQLKALGNGVVPQQSAAACRWWLSQIRSAAA